MANQLPMSGATGAAGGFLLPDEQGDLLVNGLLKEAGAIELCGDSRGTRSRKEVFPIWLGQPTATFVGEGARKIATGAELGQTNLNVKKVASIIPFTDELIEDLQNGDFDVLVDSGVRTAIRDVIDANIVGKAAGANITTNFDTMLRSTTSQVEIVGGVQDRMKLAVSAAMGILEANGYGNPANMALLLPADTPQHLRDARKASDSTTSLYDETDPFYGLQRSFSTNLNNLSAGFAANIIKGFVVYKPNLHLRIRKDITISRSNEATIDITADGISGTAATNRNLWQEDMQALRYVTRLGFMVHDLNRAVVALVDLITP